MISAVVLVKNEEENIVRCLQSLAWSDEVIVVDDYSEDETITRTKNNLKIYKRHLNADFAAQRNFGLVKAKGDWVLFIDADEKISGALASEIKTEISKFKTQNHSLKLKTNQISGFYIKRCDFLLGRWLKYGETGKIKLLRLGRKEAGKWKGNVHETWEIKGKLGELNNPIEHYPHPSIAIFLRKINQYTDIVAQSWKEQGRIIAFWEIVIYPVGKFLQNYILRIGFLDGIQGLIMATIMSFHSFLARSKYWLIQND